MRNKIIALIILAAIAATTFYFVSQSEDKSNLPTMDSAPPKETPNTEAAEVEATTPTASDRPAESAPAAEPLIDSNKKLELLKGQSIFGKPKSQ